MKQKRQLAILIALVVIAAGIWLGYFHGERGGPTVTLAMQNHPPLLVDDPKLRIDEIDRARKTEYKNVGGRNIFSREMPPPPVPKPVPKPVDQLPQVPVAPPPPVVAPLPAKFFGFGTIPNGTVRVAFLANPDGDVTVVREGEVFQNHFRILKINNSNLDYEDTSTSLRGVAPLVEEQGAPGGPSA